MTKNIRGPSCVLTLLPFPSITPFVDDITTSTIVHRHSLSPVLMAVMITVTIIIVIIIMITVMAFIV